MADRIDWEGASGKKYGYWIYLIGSDFKDQPGNYIYAKQTRPGWWAAIYIGQTSSLQDRLADHEREACAKRNGATHIHAHTSGDENTRRAEENDLIEKWDPVCNRQ
ncbi:MAG TPA: hypothetical protein VKZ50_04515 [bacterium]|nr:hypothetical protein [bacterium]